MSSRTTNLMAAVLIIIFGMAVWFYAGTFPQLGNRQPGPALFPRIIAAFLTLAGLTLLIQGWREKGGGEGKGGGSKPSSPGLLRAGLIIALASLYPLLQDRLGFVPTVSVLSFMVASLLRARLWVAALTAIGGTIFINLIFTRFLGVPL